MLLSEIKDTVTDDLDKVNQLIISNLHSEVPLVQEIGHYIIRGGGKRLRPMLVLICARACHEITDNHILMAAVIEFIHTATLLHDDVVDASPKRRNLETANNRWGNQTAVLVGDFLYSRAFQLMVKTTSVEVLRIIADATNTIAEGEVLQLLQQYNPNTAESKYLHVIRCKTATLFAAASEVASVLNNTNPNTQKIFQNIGMHLGTAYQLIDDLLDYQADSVEFGKQLGNDLAEGKATMPLLYLLHKGSANDKKLVTEAVQNPQQVDLAEVQKAICDSAAFTYTKGFAQREVNIAKDLIRELPAYIDTSKLLALADFIVERNH